MSHIHIIDPEAGRRAKVSRSVIELSFHAEIYEDFAEFSERGIDHGLILVADDNSRPLLKKLQEGAIALPVIIYSEHPETQVVVEAIQSGAFGFLEWPISRERLGRVLERVTEDDSEIVVKLRKRAAAKKMVRSLSSRELEVLAGLVDGGSNKSIGAALGISPRTVEIHRGNFMRKLNAATSAEAVRIGIYAGLDSNLDLAA